MKKLLIVLIVIMATSCASNPKWYRGFIDQSGYQKYIVICRSTTYCYSRSRWVCNGNYRIENKKVRGATYSSTSKYHRGGLFSKPRVTRKTYTNRITEWIISCKKTKK